MSELYKLHQGDCLEIMPQIDNESVDMILCDLPYGTTVMEWDVVIPFEPLWREYERIIKPNGAIVLFSSQPFTTDLINSNRILFRYEIIWKKTMKSGFLDANKRPLKEHENILVFYKKTPTYNPIKSSSGKPERFRKKEGNRSEHYGRMRMCDVTDHGERYPTDVIEFSNWNGALFGKTKNATKHPTQKPVDLCEYLIKTYTNIGDVVLDNTMGSGTTIIAALRTGRKSIGIEKNPEYFAIAQERIKQAERQPALFHEAQQSVHQTASGAGGRGQNSLQSSFIADDPPAKHGGR